MNLNYSLFKGVSIQLQNTTNEDEAVKKIDAMAEVKQIWPVRIFNVPDDEIVWTGRGQSVEQATADLKKRQADGNDTFSPHAMTQVDLLRAEGIVGTGIRVAVIDTVSGLPQTIRSRFAY